MLHYTRTAILQAIAILAGPVCVPACAIAQSPALAAGYSYLSPVPSASYVARENRFILVRLGSVSPAVVTNLTTDFISVTGGASGYLSGTTHLALDGKTIVHELSSGFFGNEVVTVALNPRVAPGGGTLAPYTYQFRIRAPMPGEPSFPPSASHPIDLPGWSVSNSAGTDPMVAEIRSNGVAVPSDFPRAVIVGGNPSPGYLFLEHGWGLPSGYSSYTMILDNNGDPVWYRRGRIWDFKVQPNGILTGAVDHGSGFQAFDANFDPLPAYYTTNGYLTDGHDLRVFSDGGYIMLGYREDQVDLSRYYIGGASNAVVREGVIQEFSATGELLFQWRSWDHYAREISTSGPDFPHMNSLAVDVDGHILVSSRQLSEVTKIDRDTGETLWRLGGPASSFSFPDDPFGGPSWQHYVTALGGNRYLLFDNGVTHTPQLSRAVEYELNLSDMTASLVWEYRATPDLYTPWMGSAQRITNGRTLINFVGLDAPVVVEVDTNGVKQFQMTLVPGAEVYRVVRGEWTGSVEAPYLVAERRSDGVTLVMNKFGDSSVDHYRIYGGISSGPTQLLASSSAPLAHLTNVVPDAVNYFRVTAVDTNGIESPYSNEESLLVKNFVPPNGEIVLNGDFSQGTNGWTWIVTPGASAQWLVTNGVSCFEITSGGTYIDQVRLEQNAISVIGGKDYILEFDAWAVLPRIIEARIQDNQDPGVNYSGIQSFTVTPVTNRYVFTFRMEAPTDNDARVVLNVGALTHDVCIDNVSLRQRLFAPGDFDGDDCVGWGDLQVLTGAWLGAQEGLIADLNSDGSVNFADFAILADGWTDGGLCP